MTKILIIGSSGSGKTTFAHKLSKRLMIPCFNLDDIFWQNETGQPFSRKRPPAECEQLVSNIIQNNPSWIIEGIYTKPWTDLIYQEAHHIYYLKANLFLRQYRIIKRYCKIQLHPTADQKNGSLKALFELLIYNQLNGKKQFQKTQEKIKQFKKQIHILK